MWKPKIFELTREGILNQEPKHFLFPTRNMHARERFRQAMRLLKQRSGHHGCLKMHSESTQCPL